jgi:adenine-specific DNA-methyltransferase
MSETYKKLIKTLRSIFEMDKADLDFGIYRIMNQKRDDINKFLEYDLLPQVKQAFSDYENSGASNLKQELETAIEQAKQFGAPDPENAPAVLDIKKRMSIVDATVLENDVFSKLHTFLIRYYDKGDFISQRRYKDGTYAIPYNGEEVKLYWANHDQYYIKSTEHLRDYAFIAKDKENNDKPFRIKLVDADIEKDNVKEKSGEERRFSIDEDKPLSIDDGQLLIHFNFLPAGKKKQEALNKHAVEVIFKQTGEEFEEWLTILKQLAPTEANKNRTILAKHLNDYTARNTFDYFIHKDLSGFLNRELDFYIKNEVLFLDDIDDKAFEVTEQQLRKIKILRSIGQKIIRMLAQLENFQKKLWLKKKFVVNTNYCLTLDQVPLDLIEQIIGNERQMSEWVDLYQIDQAQLTKDFFELGSVKFLEVEYYRYLVVDTSNFPVNFKENIVCSVTNIDNNCDGILVNSDNFQALNFLSNTLKDKIDCQYIDPPYNTDSSPILYKNGYRSSSWNSMMLDRISVGETLLKQNGVMVAAIDDAQQRELSHIMSNTFASGILGTFSVRSNPSGRPTQSGYSVAHEYLIYAGKSLSSTIGRMQPSESQMARFSQKDNEGVFEWRNLRREGSNSDRNARRFLYYPMYITDHEIRVPDLYWDETIEEWIATEKPFDNESVVFPDNDAGKQKTWRWGQETVKSNLTKLAVRKDRTGKNYVYYKRRPHDSGVVAVSTWFDAKYSSTEHGTSLLKNMFGNNIFSFPKSLHAVEDAIYIGGAANKNSVVLDFFAGSGTTGHATINMNRADNGKRKYYLVEMGKHFDDILLPRLKKSIYSSDWKDGSPINTQCGVSQFIKYLELESYEDTLNNLNKVSVKKSLSNQQQSFLDESASAREDYNLGYWLDVETENSASLLNVEQFEDPFNYQLKIGSGSVGATKPTNIDLIETFNYLLGLTVKSIDVISGFKVVIGTTHQDESVLVVWRKLVEKDNATLEEFLDEQGYNPRETEISRIYVNGDHTLEDPHSKVKMTEIEFKRLMFDTKSI